MKTLISLSLVLMIAQSALAQNNVEFFAGTIHEKGTEKSLGLVCTDAECKNLRFVKMDGRIVEDEIGAPFLAKVYPPKRDAALTNYSMFAGHSRSESENLKEQILALSGSSSKVIQVSTAEFDQALDFAKRFENLASLKFAGKIGERYSDRSISTTCADDACENVVIVLRNYAQDPGTILKSIPKSSLSKVSISRKTFRGSKAVFHSIKTVTSGENGDGGFFTDSGRMLGSGSGADITIGLFIGYTEAYAVTTIAIASAGVVTTIVESPVVLLRGIFSPIPKTKVEVFKTGGSITLGPNNFNRMINAIQALP